jgi:hypothetical protein
VALRKGPESSNFLWPDLSKEGLRDQKRSKKTKEDQRRSKRAREQSGRKKDHVRSGKTFGYSFSPRRRECEGVHADLRF